MAGPIAFGYLYPSGFIFKRHPIGHGQSNKHDNYSSIMVVSTTSSAVGGGSKIVLGCGGGRLMLIDTCRLRLLI